MKLILVALFALSFTSSYSHAFQAIKIATDGAYKPFTYVENGRLMGFDIDLMREICHRTQTECQFIYKGIAFGDLLPGLEANHWDLTIAGMGITEQRLAKYDFAGPYYKASKFFFGRKTNSIPQFPQDLIDRTVGVQDQTVRVGFMIFVNALLKKDFSGQAVIKIFPDIESIQTALLNGEIDFSIEDSGALETLAKDPVFKDFSAVGPELTSGPGGNIFGLGDGIGVKKGSALKYKINQALQGMFYDCSYAKIEKKYFLNRNPLVPKHCP